MRIVKERAKISKLIKVRMKNKGRGNRKKKYGNKNGRDKRRRKLRKCTKTVGKRIIKTEGRNHK